ncbi:CrcB family protein [Chelatococcus composti]|jgi:Integral membrane protein possibly involved in chromosome condensation|uniref:Fluoride-specific ion channel FluC n=1 Tax=Chelatococcus composti TaxID=1743235 RepID=A0A841K7U4_9HYPH|nr:CrcB family protein [Chelatococcus composti]MBB6166944.1 CrcB protein [Chelatococcus composti]MBS7737155.1 CrcB family protein [Chelatococcus composti]PZN43025.1 MAG: camphor resistance protein CrcB [Pseudomonadota bacterium]GGG24601.1 hypothetical protein GCM10008026_00870 [Chelatococcus composti]
MRREDLRICLAVGCGAALGSLLRFFVTVGVGVWPVLPLLGATAAVNVVGSFIIGFFARISGPAGSLSIGPVGRQFVMGGLCGGLTTFSALSLETFLLLGDSPGLAAVYLTAVVLLSLGAVLGGHALAARHGR